MPTTDYADRFIGGRGIATRIYWDEVPPETSAFDPANRLIFVTGPLAGFPGLAGSRWQVCGKAPYLAGFPGAVAADTAREHFSYSNFGGSWGAHLKFAGYDALVLQGKSDKPVYLLVQDGSAEIRDASALWGKGTVEVREALKAEFGGSLRVVACGPAGENMVPFASLLADEDASGSGGFGAVMGAKKLKAVAVRGKARPAAARPEQLRELTHYVRELTRGAPMVQVGLIALPKTRRVACYGCVGGCVRSVSEAKDGTRGKTLCGSATFYQSWARKYYGERTEVPFFANRLCDRYGVDALPLIPMLTWLARCTQAGILTDENTGLPLSKLGSLEFIEDLLARISFREGFGDILAQGTARAAEPGGSAAQEQLDDYLAYDPRLYITTGLFYATEPRCPIQQLHEIRNPLVKWVECVNNEEGAYVSGEVIRAVAGRFWGGELAVDYSTCEGKALCAKKVQDRAYVKECLGLCDQLPWPITTVEYSMDHVGDPTVESKILAAATGREVDEEGLYRIGERVFNLQRAILMREGRPGREADKLPEFCYTMPIRAQYRNPECLVPGKGDEVISRKGAVLDREKFEKMKDEYYQLRGWDVASGLQTKARLEELELGDVARDLESRGLTV